MKILSRDCLSVSRLRTINYTIMITKNVLVSGKQCKNETWLSTGRYAGTVLISNSLSLSEASIISKRLEGSSCVVRKFGYL